MNKIIETLLNKVKFSENPNDAVHFLFDQIQASDTFCEDCMPLNEYEKDALLKLLKPVLENRFDDCPEPTLFYPMRYKNSQLVHGILIVANYVYTLIYFEDEVVGQLTGTTQDSSARLETLRLTGFIVTQKLEPPVIVRVARNDGD